MGREVYSLYKKQEVYSYINSEYINVMGDKLNGRQALYKKCIHILIQNILT